MSTPNWIMVTVKTPQTVGDSYMANIMKNHLKEQNCSFHSEERMLFGWFAGRYHRSGMIFQFRIPIRFGQKKP